MFVQYISDFEKSKPITHCISLSKLYNSLEVMKGKTFHI